MKRASDPASDPAPVPPVPSSAKQTRALLGRLRRESELFSLKLRRLEAHPAYRRLHDTRSTGSTLQAWDRASALADELTAQLRVYLDVLDRADAAFPARGRVTRHDLVRITVMLNGPADQTDGQPAEGAGSRGVVALMAAMNATYDEVYATVDDIEECASIVWRRLDGLAETLRGLKARAASLTFRDDASIDVLDGLERELAEITPAAHADPKGCVMATGDGSGATTPDRLRRLTAGVENAQAYLSTINRQQAELQAALINLRAELTQVEALEQQYRSAEATVQTRITGVATDDYPDAAPDLRAALARLERRRSDEVWGQTSAAARELEQGLAAARDRAITRRDAARMLLEQRDELRGRLSAYRAMAIRLHHTEDLDLADEYERTYRILWSGPCDLAAATAAVASYQRAVIERTQPDDSVHSRGWEQ
jgi:hypothetical protein